MKIQNFIQEVKNVKNQIEMETKTIYENIMNRLHAQEMAKCSVLQGDLQALQNDLDLIQNFVHKISNTFQKNTFSQEDVDTFLRNFPDYQRECQFLSNKPHKTEITVTTSDFRREMKEGMESLHQFEFYFFKKKLIIE